MADLGERGDIALGHQLFRADRFGVPTSHLFRDKGPAARAEIGGHDPFGSSSSLSRRERVGERASASHAQAGFNGNTRDPRHWQRDAVTPFW